MRLCRFALAIVVVAAGCARSSGPGSGEAGCSGTRVELVRQGTLLVGTDLGRAPYAHRDVTSGDITGFEVELVRQLARRLSLEAELVNQTTPGLLPGLVAKRYDAVASTVRTSAENKAQVCLSAPYLDADLGVLSKRPLEGLSDLPDGAGLAVEGGTVSAAWASRNEGDRLKVVVKATHSDVMEAVGTPEAAAALIDLPVALVASKDGDWHLVEEIDTSEDYAIAFHPESGALRARVDAQLEDMTSDGSLDTMREKWFGR